MWISKYVRYENPYSVIGTIKFTGLKETSKVICKDKVIGTRKTWNMEL